MESVLASAGEERDLSAIREAIGTVSPTPLTGGDVAAEGDSLALIFSALLQRAADPESDETRLAGAVAEALARHPSIGVDKVASAAALLLGKDQTDPLVDALRDELTAVAGKPVGEESFSDSAAAMMAAVNAMSVLEGNTEGTADAFAVLLSTDGDLLSRLSGMLSDKLLRSIGFTEETAEKVSSLFPSIADVISSSAYSKAEARAEAEALNRILTAEVALADGAEDRWEQIDEMLETYVSSDVCARVTKVLTAEKSDPLSLYRDLSDADRETLLGRLSATAAAHPEKAEALSDLARFFGLSLAK